MNRFIRAAALATTAILVAEAPPTRAASLHFAPSDLPPPVTDDAAAPSFYRIFVTTDRSPLGKAVDSVKPADLIDEAASFIKGSDGHQANPDEAAFWLKRAILVAPDETGRRRSWAVTNLGLILYNSNDSSGHAAGRYLWEIAAAWNNPEALCNLGQLAEIGDDVAKADIKKAISWYQSAKKAGCAQADQAISRLSR